MLSVHSCHGAESRNSEDATGSEEADVPVHSCHGAESRNSEDATGAEKQTFVKTVTHYFVFFALIFLIIAHDCIYSENYLVSGKSFIVSIVTSIHCLPSFVYVAYERFYFGIYNKICSLSNVFYSK